MEGGDTASCSLKCQHCRALFFRFMYPSNLMTFLYEYVKVQNIFSSSLLAINILLEARGRASSKPPAHSDCSQNDHN